MPYRKYAENKYWVILVDKNNPAASSMACAKFKGPVRQLTEEELQEKDVEFTYYDEGGKKIENSPS